MAEDAVPLHRAPGQVELVGKDVVGRDAQVQLQAQLRSDLPSPARRSARCVVVRFCMKKAGRTMVQPRPEARRRFSMRINLLGAFTG